MKKSKHENSVFPYSLHSTVNLPAGDRYVTIMYFIHLFNETITPERRSFFTNYMKNIAKIGEIREELSTSHFLT